MDRRRAATEAGNPAWADLPASEREAKALLAAGWPVGLPKLIFTGRACNRGHIAPRRASGYCCCVCDAAMRSTPEAKEKERAYNQRPDVAARRRERENAAYEASPELREQRRLYLREYFARPEVKEAHRLYMRENQATRDARKLQATPPWLTDDQRAAIRATYDEAIRLTEETGIPHEVDHIAPLRNPLVCGLHVPWNLQVLTKDENNTKNNRFDGGW